MLGVAADPLARAGRSFDNWIDRFQVARVCRQTNLHLRSRGKLPDRAITKVIFHIAISAHQVRNVVRGELGEENLERFLEEISQHI